MHVFMITSEWPSPYNPFAVPFIVRQVEFLRQAGVNVDVFHFRGAGKIENYTHAWNAVHKRLAYQKYDLIHAQWGQSALLSMFTQIPLVITFRGSDLNGLFDTKGRLTVSGFLLRKISQLVAYKADGIILVSQNLAKYLPDKKYHIIPSGIDTLLFQPMPKDIARTQLNLSLDRKYVLFTGGIKNPIKRYELARAATSLLSGNVEMLLVNSVSHDQIPLYLNAADVLLLTSIREGSPNIVKEALSCNLPVVSVDVGDVRERIENIEGCVVCEDVSPQSIAGALEKVLRRGNRVDGRQAVKDLDEQLLAQKIIAVYKSVLATS